MAKKIKKVDTPIDQRETFVSIQKNFADSDISVEEKLRTLYELQKADSEIDKILQLRGALPTEVKTLEEELVIMKAKEALLRQEEEGYRETINMKKQEKEECEIQISKLKAQLDNISNSREFDVINKEIENQELLVKIADKSISEAKFAIGQKKDLLDTIKDQRMIREDDLKAKKAELATIVESTSETEAALHRKRELCASKIDERTMSAYERIRSSERNHLAVVTVYNGNACGGCFNSIIPQRLIDIQSNRKLVLCEHCGRIIVNPEFPSQQA